MKEKLYYDKKTGFLCDRAPKCIQRNEDSPFIEVDEENINQTYVCETGTFWGVKDGKLQLLDDRDSEEYKELERKNHIADLHAYLNDTDYVVSKLQESKLVDSDEDYQKMFDSYKDILKKRKEVREELNNIQNS